MIKMLHEVLVKVPEAYATEIKLNNSHKIFVENKTNDVRNTIRYGIVEALPELIPVILEVNDTVFFHHNIVRKNIDMHGKEQIGFFEFDKREGLYRCPADLIFAYVRDGVFKAVDPYCFVKPIDKKDVVCKGHFLVKNVEDEINHFGILTYGNEELKKENINDGDLIIFSKDSEYEYNIFGERLYKMNTRDILAKVKGVEWTGEEDLSNNLS